MAKRNWADGALGNTPLNAARLNQLEADLEAALLQLARNPEALFAGAFLYTRHVVTPAGVAMEICPN